MAEGIKPLTVAQVQGLTRIIAPELVREAHRLARTLGDVNVEAAASVALFNAIAMAAAIAAGPNVTPEELQTHALTAANQVFAHVKTTWVGLYQAPEGERLPFPFAGEVDG